MCGVSWACSLAGRFSMPVLLRNRRLADGAGSVAMQPVSASNIGDGGDDLRGHSKAIAPLVPGDVVRDQPEARGQCARPATHSWPGQLSDRLGLAAQVANVRAMVRPGRDSPGRRGRGGRNLCGRPRNRRRGATDEDQVDRRDCGGSPRAGHWPDPNEPRRGCGCEEPDARLSKQPWRLARPSEPMAGQPTVVWRTKAMTTSRDPFPPVATRPTSSCHECIAWPLCLIAGGWASTMVPSMPTISDYYLDEFTFRFNRRRSQARGLLFFRLLQQAVQHEPVPYKGLVGGHRSLGNQM